MKTEYEKIKPYTTKDGSIIRELMHPDQHGNKMQSLAEATIQAGSETFMHKHLKTEEIYHITQGRGVMVLGDSQLDFIAGDTILIPPGTLHLIRNNGYVEVKILCCCSPPYSHNDTMVMT
jgi:mannose-6-phosphate isomerase-like protein (cupin superfamily)